MAQPLNHVGVFTISTGAAGAPTLEVVITVPQNSSTATGTGRLTQATNPPLNVMTAFHGQVHATGLGTTEQLYALQGQALPPYIGATFVSQLSIALDGIWGTKGVASYIVYNDTPTPKIVDGAPVRVQWLLQQ